jgi:cytosine/adenosine deaminase-related metal-dependent hydrolase
VNRRFIVADRPQAGETGVLRSRARDLHGRWTRRAGAAGGPRSPLHDGKIAQIGRLSDSAKGLVDASAVAVVAPGSIDPHTRCDRADLPGSEDFVLVLA